MAVDACCCEEQDTCVPCPAGTVYPWLVSVSFPSLGVSELAANELDPDEDGETTFLYRVEGTYGGYDFQCTFGDCDASVVVFNGDEGVCSGGGAEGVGVSMVATSCPPDPLVLVYTIRCSNGSTLEVIIAE